MTTVDKQLTSHVPVHTNHDDEQASSTVYQRKEELKRKAVETDLPTKRLAADAVSGKMNCHISSLARMARRTRQAADKHPATPETWSTSVSLVTTSSLTNKNLFEEVDSWGPYQPSSWTMSLSSTTLLQRCGPQLPDGAATSTSNSPC